MTVRVRVSASASGKRTEHPKPLVPKGTHAYDARRLFNESSETSKIMDPHCTGLL